VPAWLIFVARRDGGLLARLGAGFDRDPAKG
jgi:hypothetical protein